MRGLVFALCSLIAAQSAFVPQSTFCATAEGQIACDVPCPANDADTGKNSTYCVTQTSQGFPGEYPAFQYCLSVGSPYLNPSSNACPARPAGKCADIGKVCSAKHNMGGLQECPPVGGDACTGASCDGTCGCGCAKIRVRSILCHASTTAAALLPTCFSYPYSRRGGAVFPLVSGGGRQHEAAWVSGLSACADCRLQLHGR